MSMRRVQQGVGLVEVMVALLLLSIAVLGFVALQVRASAAGSESFGRTQAMAIAQDMAERVRLNLGEIGTYTAAANWGAAGDITACEGGKTCAANQLAQYDIDNVRNSAATMLPNGQVIMQQCVGSQVNCIYVSWDDTQPTVGNGDTDCVTSVGRYRQGATCVMMEAY